MQLTWTPIAKISTAQAVETSVTVFQQQQSYSGQRPPGRSYLTYLLIPLFQLKSLINITILTNMQRKIKFNPGTTYTRIPRKTANFEIRKVAVQYYS